MNSVVFDRVTMVVTAQTAYNLQKLADMAGHRCPGRVVDKLVRDQMVRLRAGQSELPY